MANYTPIDYLTKDKIKQQTPVSVGGAERGEYAPSLTQESKVFEIHEVAEHEPDKDIEQFVEVKKDKVKIPKLAQKAGMTDTGSTSFPAYNPVKLPVSDKEVYSDLQQPITSSARWFGEVCLFILKQAHLSLKKIHGKIVRVIQ